MLRPENEAALAEAVASAAEPLAIMGGGTRGFAAGGAALSVAGLSGVSIYEPGALTLVAGAGTPLAEVEALLDEAGQMLPFEPMDSRKLLGTSGVPTIGGMAATNASGPRRVQAGACRDAMLGVRFVDGSGTVIANGGRVMKNVTGYDLVKLLAGSYGTLGVLTEVAFKVLPKPEATATVTLRGLGLGDAVAAMSAALGSPYDVSGAAHDPQAGATWVRLEGFEASVAYRAEALKGDLGRFGEVSVESGREAWAAVRDVEALAGAAAVWRLSVQPSAAPDLAARLAQIGAFRLLFDWGGGRVWAGCDGASDAVHGQVLGAAAEFGGHGVMVKVPEGLSAGAPAPGWRFGARSPGVAKLEAGLRAKFDPRGILNAGLLGGAA